MNRDWINELTDEISNKARAISGIWDAIGIEGDRLQSRKESLSVYLLTMLDDMYEEELGAKQGIIDSIEGLKREITELESELEFPHTPFPESLSLLATENALYERSKILKERATCVVETFNSLRKEEECLSQRLGEPTTVIVYKHAPNQAQLRSLKTNLDFLISEKRSRVLKLSKLRQNILSVHAAIGTEVMIDKDILAKLSSDEALESLPLSKTFLSQAEDLCNRCIQRMSEVTDECSSLSQQIQSLATRLGLTREELLDFDQPVSTRYLSELKNEFTRLTKMRRENLSVFIENCRAELKQWWDDCFLCESERDCLLVSDDFDFSESLLETLESEIKKWKNYYEENRPLFESINSWKITLFQLHEVEAKKRDPNTLKNRGGILLAVEREYKQLQREIKRLKSTIQNLSENPAYSTVLVFGMHPTRYLEVYTPPTLTEIEKGNKKTSPLANSQSVTASRTVGGKRLGPKPLQANTRSNQVYTTVNSAKKPRMDVMKDTFCSTASGSSSTLSHELCGSPVTSSSFLSGVSRSLASSHSKSVRNLHTPTARMHPTRQSPRLGAVSKTPNSVQAFTPRLRRSGRLLKPPTVFSSKSANNGTPTHRFLHPTGQAPRSAKRTDATASTPRKVPFR
ncbi:unnamed protein product [Calicophoron daubneyi]|uniref:Protein regulator of cytokinesis 1 n=1 Tax=Calicophoron daubneyi TaxID=300641 RepID=A0AAV2T8X6_CALDB